MENIGTVAPAGVLGMSVTKDLGELRVVKAPLGWRIRNLLLNRSRDLPRLLAMRLLGKVFGVIVIESALYLKVLRGDGQWVDYGCVGTRVVTDVGVGFIVDAFQNLVELENMKYHGFGTGTTAESAAQTALVTELTTEYATDSTRPTGTTTEGATANIYRTVATLSPDSGTPAITEHGVFSASSSGVLLDRTKFSAINLTGGSDSLQATYELTLTSGS